MGLASEAVFVSGLGLEEVSVFDSKSENRVRVRARVRVGVRLAARVCD